MTVTQPATLSSARNRNNLRVFRRKIEEHFGGKIELIAQERKCDSLLIIPNYSKELLVKTLNEKASEQKDLEIEHKLLKTLTETDLDTEFLISMHHVTSRIRSDLKSVKSHRYYDGIDQKHIEECVPPSLFMFLSMLAGHNKGEEQREKILSIAQDIVYISSGGRTLTPKHIFLAATIHHANRNKSLVQLMHAAGHCSSYEMVEKLDTSIAKSEVARWKDNGKLVVPPNLRTGIFTQFAGDDINIKVETLDGKGIFNATHCAAF